MAAIFSLQEAALLRPSYLKRAPIWFILAVESPHD